MRQAYADLRQSLCMAWDAYRRLVRNIRQRYWPYFIGALVVLIIAWAMPSMTDIALFRVNGTVPLRAMEIRGSAAWWVTDTQPKLVIVANRHRYVACPGAYMKRELIYTDGPNVAATAEQASKASSLSSTPAVRSPVDSPDIQPFSLVIPVKRTDNLKSVRWHLFASPGQCADGEARIGEGVGLIEVPPYPKRNESTH